MQTPSKKYIILRFCSCCEGQGTRTFGSFPRFVYLVDEESGVYVDQFFASGITTKFSKWNNESLSVNISGSFPYGVEDLSLSVVASGNDVAWNAVVYLRIPDWAGNQVSVKVGSDTTLQGSPSTYLKIKYNWSTNPTKPTIIKPLFAYPLQAFLYNGSSTIPGASRVAVRQGPVLLAFVATNNNTAWNTTTDSVYIRGVCTPLQPSSYLTPTGTLTYSVKNNPDITLQPYFDLNQELFDAYPAFE